MIVIMNFIWEVHYKRLKFNKNEVPDNSVSFFDKYVLYFLKEDLICVYYMVS